ncbi:LysM peptidoglycan-binding domain-containing protein [Bacillus salipaludis]|uniref:LysM peptidoglycan-binding domain-containing protein n=1 Tax=Bacillus salipaludis TaxID=2547811 RepID=A0ABW8RPB9_9BACI
MNKEEPYRDQAERLKQRIQKINDRVEDGDSDKLPPRERVHRQKKKKTKWKLKYPIIRLLVLCFILLPIIIFSVISYRDSGKKINGTEKTSGSSVGYETINIEKTQQEDENISEEQKETKQENIDLSETEEKSSESKEAAVQPVTSNHSDTSIQSPSSNNDSANKQVPDKNSQQQTTDVKSETNTNSTAQTRKIIYHTVKPQETLFKLATKYYKSQKGIDIIKKENKLQSENIYAGQVLKIPLNN